MRIDNSTISIDTSREYFFGSDQANLNYPVRFPTVTFFLEDTSELNRISDNLRKALGELPMFDRSGACDENGWYEYTIGINDFTPSNLDTCIEVTVCNSDDDGDGFLIHLSEDEQRQLYDVLNRLCMKHYGKSCADLLDESRREMLEIYGR